jgi:hypothetical protein
LLVTACDVGNRSASYFYGIIPRESDASMQRQLLKAIEKVDGLVTSDEEVGNLMLGAGKLGDLELV